MKKYKKITKRRILYKEMKTNEEDEILFKELAVKHDIKDENGIYSADMVRNMVSFMADAINSYLSTPGNYLPLRTPMGIYVPKLKNIRKRIHSGHTDITINEAEKYTDWYNNYCDIIRYRHKFRDEENSVPYLECPNEEFLAEEITNHNFAISEKKSNRKDLIELKRKYLYKAVQINSGRNKGVMGIIVKVEKDKVVVRISTNQVFYEKYNNVNLLSNLTTL